MKKLELVFSIMNTCILFILGLGFIFYSISVYRWIHLFFLYVICSLLIVKGIDSIIRIFKKRFRVSSLFEFIFYGILLLANVNEMIFFKILALIVGLWLILHAIIKIIVIYVRKIDGLYIGLFRYISFLADVIMSSFLLFHPDQHESVISLVVGCFFLLHAINGMIRFHYDYLSDNQKWNRPYLAVSPFIAMIIPPSLLKILIDEDKDRKIKYQFDVVKKDIPIDMEVLIHLAPSGYATFGHADLVYQGQIFSYGCYDPHTRRLFGTLGDGVVIHAQRDPYIYNCLKNENKTLISFGIKLNEMQKEALDERIKKLFNTFEPFYSDEDLKRANLPYKGICDDYISRVTRTSPGSHFYKIRQGKFKTFFVMSNNCVSFLSYILSVVGFKIVDLSGIISPGAYYDFMNKQFLKNKSFVIYRKVYRKKDCDQFL